MQYLTYDPKATKSLKSNLATYLVMALTLPLALTSCDTEIEPVVTETPIVVEEPKEVEPDVHYDPPVASTTQVPSDLDIELDDWYLSVPSDEDGNGRADSIRTSELISGYSSKDYFFATTDNGITFKSPSQGYRTSENTKYVRSELREMLRRDNSSIKTQGVNRNNWVFSTAPDADKLAAGGIDGRLEAELSVNKVTETGEYYQVGRVIIGQIHANDDEPIRLYYRKLPHHHKGSIYYAHEPIGKDDVYREMIGARSDSASEPSDGIALNERFGYEIEVIGNLLLVTIKRDGKEDVTSQYDMSDSGYDQGGQYMYFKAGVYNQNNSSAESEYVQATFYKIKNSHDGYQHSEY